MNATVCTRPECQTSAGCQCQRADRRFVVSSVEWPPHNDPRIAALEAALSASQRELATWKQMYDTEHRACLALESALAESRTRENDLAQAAYIERDESVAALAKLQQEASALAADQCHCGYCDEYGHHRCRFQDDLAEARREIERLRGLVTRLLDSVVINDSYGVQGSEFQTCLACQAGGAPGIPLEHSSICPVGQAEDVADRWFREHCDEMEEQQREIARLAAMLAAKDAALEPFALAADRYEPDEGDGLSSPWAAPRFTIDDLHRARAAFHLPTPTPTKEPSP